MGAGFCPRRRPVVMLAVDLAGIEDLRRTSLLEGMDTLIILALLIAKAVG